MKDGFDSRTGYYLFLKCFIYYISGIIMKLKPGQVVITQGKPNSIISQLIRFFTGSWWTHGFVVLNETEGIEAKIPRVTRLNIEERLRKLDDQGRDYVVLDLPGITDEERLLVAQAAAEFEGRLYDIWNILYYALFKVWVEGGKRLVCSRLMAAAFYDGIANRIFWGAENKLPPTELYRLDNLYDGYCTPDEVLRYSLLTEVWRSSNLIK